MSHPLYTLSVEYSPSPADVDAVRWGLINYNRRYLALDNYKPVHIFVRDPAGSIVGGLIGDIYWNSMHIDILWLDDHARGQGVGTELMERAEELARQHNCNHVHLDTMSFQGRGFYEKLGYRVFGVLDGYPNNSSRYYMVKDLA